MAYILNIESSTKNCSVCISKDGELINIREINEGQFSHAEKLHPFIEEVIRESNISFADLNAVAVSKGPGSYTGLRIGVSAAKGLCYTLGIPLISVDTLQVLASAAKVEEDALIIPLLDARRMEVYGAVFNSVYKKIRETEAEIIDEKSFATYLQKGKVCFLGDGAEKCKTVIKDKKAVFLDGYYPSSKQMIPFSTQKFKNSEFEDVAYFEPFYLKDFIAGKPKSYFKRVSR